MAFGPDNRWNARAGTMSREQAYAAHIDVGLRQYMLRVYNYMASGLALTGIVAWIASNTPAILNLLYAPNAQGGYSQTALWWVVALAPIGMVFFLAAKIQTMKASTAQTMFWVYAGLMGLSLAHVFLIYTGASVARVFFITAGAFAGLSLVGYTTKKDLSGFGSFLIMGVWGILIAAVVNIFLASSVLDMTISVVGVLIFAGLTAYDTQRIKSLYLEADGSEVMTKKAIMGALTLYLDFINMFLMMLRLFGNRE